MRAATAAQRSRAPIEPRTTAGVASERPPARRMARTSEGRRERRDARSQGDTSSQCPSENCPLHLALSIADHFTFGLLATDAAGRLIWTNRRGQSMLDSGEGLTVRKGRLCCLRRSDTSGLFDAMQSVLASNAPGSSARAWASISQRTSSVPLGIAIIRIGRAQTAPVPDTRSTTAALGHPALLIVVSDATYVPRPSVEALKSIFRFTQAEARLAAALAGRLSLEDYAREACVSLGTARWTLRRILEKTDTHRQPELVHILATSVTSLLANR